MATLYILYGSATGNAEGIAKDLAERRPLPAGFDSVVCEAMEKFKKLSVAWASPPAGLAKHGVILVTSTTGNAEAPENASRFVRFIKRRNNVEARPYTNVAFSVLALGDSNYDVFCATGITVDKQMGLLGGVRAKKLACADEGTGLEEVVEPWTASVFDDIAKACAADGAVSGSASALALVEGEVQKTEEATAVAPAAVTPTPAAVAPTPVAIKPVDKANTPLFILYGSATGNAEHIAKDLASTYELILKNPDAKCFFPSVICCEADQFKKKCQPHWETEPQPGTKHGVLLITSTTGNGDAPENVNRFTRYLKRKTTVEAQPFRHCAFSVLALGDTNYDQFCETGRVADKQIKLLGGTRAKPLACADEATGLEDVVDPWCHTVFLDITNACKVDANETAITTTAAKPTVVAKTPVPPASSIAEEKKTEMPGEVAEESFGVRALRSLLQLESSASIPTVPNSSLPSLLKSRSSCELIGDDMDIKRDRADSFSSVGSGEPIYTYRNPYFSSIASARYLTNTSTDGAAKIVDAFKSTGIQSDDDMLRCHSILDGEFLLGAASDATVKEQPEIERNGKRVIELKLKLPEDSTLEYQPGDSLGLIVPNSAESVAFVLAMIQRRHGIAPTQKILIDAEKHTTVDEACREQFDLCTAIRHKRTLLNLSQLATSAEEAAALRYLSSKDGDAIYQTYIVDQRKTIVGLLQDFPSCQKMSLESLFALLPVLPPRYYSVASSPLHQSPSEQETDNTLTIAFSVVDYVTPSLMIAGKEEGKRRVHGVATKYLEAFCASHLAGAPAESFEMTASLPIFPKATADFRLPLDTSVPIILIGPGTGIAPFMGFLADRKGTAGSVDVYFGCRHEDHDWIYADEMKQYQQDGTISKLFTVFSRDNRSLDNKVKYVQDIMRHNEEASQRLRDILLNQKGMVYICGDGTHMGRDVQVAIAEVLGKDLGGAHEGMKAIVEMKASGRFLLDLWG